MKCLAVCPTIYPEKFAKMYDSFQIMTSKYTTLLIIKERGEITTLLNEAFRKHNDYDFYIVLNDDIRFETPLWDTALAKKGHITHGTDNITNGHTGNFLMIDGDFCRALGWLQMPALNRYGGDVVWKFIGVNTSTLHYVPEVKIRHNWSGCEQPEVNTADMEAFARWLVGSKKEINIIKEVAKNVGV